MSSPCGFKTNNPDEEFPEDNWNDPLINKIRDICDGTIHPLPRGVHRQWHEDQSYATILTEGILPDADCLWLSWYKRRGATDAMWLLSSYDSPRLPTRSDLQEIVDVYINGKPRKEYWDCSWTS